MTEFLNNKIRIDYETLWHQNVVGKLLPKTFPKTFPKTDPKQKKSKCLRIKGLILDNINYNFELNFEIKPRKEYYLLYASFTTENKSTRIRGNHHWIGAFETKEDAIQAAKKFDQSILPESESRQPLVYQHFEDDFDERLARFDEQLIIKPVKLTGF